MKNRVLNLIVIMFCILLSIPAIAAEIDKDSVMQAISKYNTILETDANNVDALYNRAYLEYVLGDIASAIKDYDLLLALQPNNKEFYLNRGYLKHIINKREEALKDYDAALKIDPNYAFAYNNRGVALSELGRNDESLTAYNRAIEINPNYSDAYYNRGNLMTKTNKDEEALEDYNAAIQLNPKDSASFNNRGVVKRKLNFNVGALSDFSIAIKLDPEDITAYANRGRLKKRFFDSEGAEEDFTSAIAIADNNPFLVQEIQIENEIASNQKPQVQPATPVAYKYTTPELNKELRIPRTEKQAMQKLAQNRINEVKVAQVQASVMKVEPKSVSATKPALAGNTVNAVHKVTNTPSTVKVAAKTPEINVKPVQNPKLAECYYIRALQKYILQNRESALADFNMAIRHNPEYAEAYYYRAAIKRDLKDDGFVDDYKKAVSLNPSLKAVNDNDVLTILKI